MVQEGLVNDSPYCPTCGTKRLGAFRFCRSCRLDFDQLPDETPTFAPEPATPAVVWAGPDARVVAWVAEALGTGSRSRDGDAAEVVEGW
jgi:hypothetical protein